MSAFVSARYCSPDNHTDQAKQCAQKSVVKCLPGAIFLAAANQVANTSSPGGFALQSHRYVDRQPWSGLEGRSTSDYTLHWEDRAIGTSDAIEVLGDGVVKASSTRQAYPTKNLSDDTTAEILAVAEARDDFAERETKVTCPPDNGDTPRSDAFNGTRYDGIIEEQERLPQVGGLDDNHRRLDEYGARSLESSLNQEGPSGASEIAPNIIARARTAAGDTRELRLQEDGTRTPSRAAGITEWERKTDVHSGAVLSTAASVNTFERRTVVKDAGAARSAVNTAVGIKPGVEQLEQPSQNEKDTPHRLVSAGNHRAQVESKGGAAMHSELIESVASHKMLSASRPQTPPGHPRKQSTGAKKSSGHANVSPRERHKERCLTVGEDSPRELRGDDAKDEPNTAAMAGSRLARSSRPARTARSSRSLDERAVWIQQTLRVAKDHNLVMASDIEGESRTRGAGSRSRPRPTNDRSLKRSPDCSARRPAEPFPDRTEGRSGIPSGTRIRSDMAAAAWSASKALVGERETTARLSDTQFEVQPYQPPEPGQLERQNETVILNRTDTTPSPTDSRQHRLSGQVKHDTGQTLLGDDSAISPEESSRQFLQMGEGEEGRCDRRGVLLKRLESTGIRRARDVRRGKGDTRVRIKAFNVVVEEYKQQQREVGNSRRQP